MWETGLHSSCIVFFFFQAEDGIRDVAVTGVQTCALPIFAAPSLVMTKGGPATMNPGQLGQFTLNVQNTGNSDAWNATIVDKLPTRSEEHTSELQSRLHLVCRLLLEKKKNEQTALTIHEHD